MTLTGSGSLGVGGSHSPSATLDIVGDIEISTVAEVDDSTQAKVLIADAGGKIDFRYEKVGTFSGTTTAGGQLTVAHGLGVTPNWAHATTEGTNRLVVNIVSMDGTNIIFHISQDDVDYASSAVKLFWIAKKY